MRTIQEIKKSLEKAEEQLTSLKSELSLYKNIKPEKTYPIGYDPDGEWTLVYDETEEKLIPHSLKIHITSKEFALDMGILFTTKEQAEKAAVGKNAMRELVMAIHEVNKGDNNPIFRIIHDGEYTNLDVDCSTFFIYPSRKLRITSKSAWKDILEKLGEEKIKIALEWGM